MTFLADSHSKGIIQTFYTVLIALLAIGLLVLILVLFVQKFYDIQLTIQDTEQDRAVINLAQVLMSSDKLVYVDSDGVVHRGVIDADKTKNVNMDGLRNQFSYTGFYYTLTITDLEYNCQVSCQTKDVTPSISAGESLAQFGKYGISLQTRNYPVAIRYADGTIDAGVMLIKSGFASIVNVPEGTVTTSIPAVGVG